MYFERRLMKIAFYILLVSTVTFVTDSIHAKIDPDTIVGAWLFEEGKGKVAEDLSGGQHNGKLEKGPRWVRGKSGPVSYTHLTLPTKA